MPKTKPNPPNPEPAPDLDVESHGSIVLLRPRSETAEEWLRTKCDAPSWAWMGGALAVEPRMLDAIVAGARADGLNVRGDAL